MLRSLEILLLYFIDWFYQLPAVVGLLTLGMAAVACLIAQFFIAGNTTLVRSFVPGVFGLLFFIAEILHLTDQRRVLSTVDSILEAFQSDVGGVNPIPVLEPLVSLLVAPAASRFVFEESLFVVLSAYLFFVIQHSIAEYRKTGVIIGDLSFSSLMKDKGRRPKRSLSNELGSGDLANTEQIANWMKPSGKTGDTYLNVAELRGSEGLAFPTGKLCISRDERNRHVLVVAKTGSGKTSRFILPILYNDCMDPVCSTIVIDSKPEMWRKLAAMTRKYNPEKNILLFNPLDRARSLSWNILGKIDDDTDCKLIAQTIISATDQPLSLIHI